MRSYDVAVASLAIDAPAKWTDNLLSQHTIPNVLSEHRGVARRITHHALVRIAIVRQLHVRLGVSVADAVRIAAQLLDSRPAGVHASGQLTLTLDLEELERALDARLAEVLESAPAPGADGRPEGRERKTRRSVRLDTPPRTLRARPRYSGLRDVLGRRALGALHDVELHRITLGQRLEAVALDRAVVHEAILFPRCQG